MSNAELNFEQSPGIGNILLASQAVSGDSFKEKPDDCKYWVGIVAANGEVVQPDFWRGLGALRGNVYVWEKGYLVPEVLDSEGLEYDHFDDRSVNFSVVEAAEVGSRVVGSGRLISKNKKNKLPIEDHFPEIFKDKPVDDNAVEVSRFIARHESKLEQRKIKLAVLRALTFYSINNKVSVDYCLIEKPLLKMFCDMGLPAEVLGSRKNIPELGGDLYPVSIDPNEVVRSLRTGINGRGYREFFEDQDDVSGIGYFDATMTRSIK